MPLVDFETHLNHAAPGFRCFACGDRTETPTFLARVMNSWNPPGNKLALAAIDRLLGSTATIIKEFYAIHDGVLMYEDMDGVSGDERAVGIAFFPVAEWEAKTTEMRERLLAMGWTEEEMPDWLRHGIAFGEIPHSANYFVIQPSGKDAGKVFYADHDAFDPEPIAKSFEEFLDDILADPAGFLKRVGCYTRYSDGTTGIQWIPKEYVPG